MEKKHIQHLYWRAGFGITPGHLKNLQHKTRQEVVNELFNKSKRYTPLQLDTSEFKNLNPKFLKEDKDAFKKVIERLKERLIDLNSAWIDRLSKPKELLREKMTLFWANHFVCQDFNVIYAEQFNNTLRKHALGNFRNFTKAISKEAAMIKYLNLKQNKRQSPNENFARELMELFTLGNQIYSEEDIKESARAFTGYGHDFFGKFQLRRMQHDYDQKTFFGRTGSFDGDDIIDIILVEKQCAKFICEKIYRYFVNQQLNDSHIDAMMAVFYPSYDIEDLMYFVFMSDWFYDEENIGAKIKSPIELLIGINTVIPMTFTQPLQLLAIQKLLGQILLYPPNVAGWEGGRQWIDSNTILLRLRLPSVLLNNAQISLKEHDDFNDRFIDLLRKHAKGNNIFKVESDWNQFNQRFFKTNENELSSLLLQCQINKGTQQLLNNLKPTTKRDYCIQLMSLPEYQMC